MKLLKKKEKHKHILAGNYNSCLTTIHVNNCRLQVLYDNVVSVVSTELVRASFSCAVLLQIMYRDMHIYTSAPTARCFQGIESLLGEAVTSEYNCFS